jgi:uncharacterized repeat protein (TIGR01451 family)
LELVLRAGYRALLVIPLVGPESVVGALVVRRKAPGEFPKQSTDLLQTFAAQSVLAIQNAHLFTEIGGFSADLTAKQEFFRQVGEALQDPRLWALFSMREDFVAALDPTGFGEGQTYAFTATEGSGADTDATSSTYGPGAVNGVVQGTDTTNRFAFTVATPAGVSVGGRLTATARVAGSTSEFSAALLVAAAPVYSFTKVSAAITDPVNCTTPGNAATCTPVGSQKRIPGAIVEYTILLSNSGGASDPNSVQISDPIPTNTALRVVDLGGAGSGPVAFANGATSSGLTYTFTSLASATDDLEFSNNGGTTWTYTPVAAANGCDNAVTNLRVNPKGTYVADSGTPDPSFTLRFRICLK